MKLLCCIFAVTSIGCAAFNGQSKYEGASTVVEARVESFRHTVPVGLTGVQWVEEPVLVISNPHNAPIVVGDVTCYHAGLRTLTDSFYDVDIPARTTQSFLLQQTTHFGSRACQFNWKWKD